MKKIVKVLLMLIPFAILGCSDSDSTSDETTFPLINQYESFSTARSVWKEPAGYSYSVCFHYSGSNPPVSYMVDVKVANGESTISLNSNNNSNNWKYYSDAESELKYECKRIEDSGWAIKTITDLFNSIEKFSAVDSEKGSHVIYVDREPKTMTEVLDRIHFFERLHKIKTNFAVITYNDCNGRVLPVNVSCSGISITITDFKIQSE